MNIGSPSNETAKTEVPCHSRCGTLKIPPCSTAVRAEHRPTFCSRLPAMVTSPNEPIILQYDLQKQINKQTKHTVVVFFWDSLQDLYGSVRSGSVHEENLRFNVHTRVALEMILYEFFVNHFIYNDCRTIYIESSC